MLIEITDHAYDRMNERCGFNKRAGSRMAKLAYNKGLKHSETSGKIYEYIAHKAEKVNQNASKSACPATSDQLGRIAADLNGDALDSVCHAVSPPP